MKLSDVPLTEETKIALTADVWRPYMGGIFRVMAIEIAQELNKTSLQVFDDQDITRLALAELYVRAFPERSLYPEARQLLKRYDKDPGIVQSG